MGSVFTNGLEDRGSVSGHTKDLKDGTWHFFAKNPGL